MSAFPPVHAPRTRRAAKRREGAPQFAKFQPGAIAPEMALAVWHTGASRRPASDHLDVDSLVRQGQMFAGNPDTVVKQIKEFRRRVGGIHHIIMMTRQGLVTHAEAEKSFTLAAREVLPQLQDVEPIDERWGSMAVAAS